MVIATASHFASHATPLYAVAHILRTAHTQHAREPTATNAVSLAAPAEHSHHQISRPVERHHHTYMRPPCGCASSPRPPLTRAPHHTSLGRSSRSPRVSTHTPVAMSSLCRLHHHAASPIDHAHYPNLQTVSSGSLEAPCSFSCASLVRHAAAGRAEGSRRRGKRTSALAAAHSRCHAHSRRDTPSAPITLSGVARASSCRHEGHTKWLPLRPRQRWARRSRARLRDDGGTDDLRHAAHLCHLRG